MDRRAESIGPAVRRGTLRPVAGAFLVFGSFAGAWAVAVIDIERTFGLSDAELGAVLAIGIVLAAAVERGRWCTHRPLGRGRRARPFARHLERAARGGRARAGARLCSPWRSPWRPRPGGFVDVVMNVVAAAALSETPGRLLRFHGLFNLGALLGAAATGIALELDASWRVVWVGIAVLGFVLALDQPLGDAAEPAARSITRRCSAPWSGSAMRV